MRGLEGTLAPESSTPGFVWVKKSQVNADKILSHRQLYEQLLIPKDITGGFRAALLKTIKNLKQTRYTLKVQWVN